METKDGKVYIPKDMVDVPSLTRDSKARLAIAALVGGGAICGAVNLALNAANFVRDCANESVLRIALGFPRPDLIECAQETWPMLKSFFR